MRYRELLSEMKKLSEKQLNDEVRIIDNEDGQLYNLDIVDEVGETDSDEDLRVGQKILVLR